MLTSSLVAGIERHLRGVLPHEGCGLLAVSVDGEVRRALRFYPGTNVDASASRFTMDPREVARALAGIERRGWQLGAIVHSHPRTPALPSATDLREAFYPDAWALIVSFAAEPPEMRAWDVGAEANRGVAEVAIRRIDA